MHHLKELVDKGEVGSDEEHRPRSVSRSSQTTIRTRSTTSQAQGRGDPRSLRPPWACSTVSANLGPRSRRRSRSAASRSSWTATGAGRCRGTSGGGGPPRGNTGPPADSRGRNRAGDRFAGRLRLLDRELDAPARRGRLPDGDLQRDD
jgi:hypothetical protein